MSQKELIHELRSHSTWRLLGLGIITYGVYYAHYCRSKTRLINRRLDREQQIPTGLTATLFILSYVSLALFFGYLFVDEHHPIAVASNVADRIWIIVIIVRGFYARNRMNTLMDISADHPDWFHGLWSFLLSPLYFNYKINVLDEKQSIA